MKKNGKKRAYKDGRQRPRLEGGVWFTEYSLMGKGIKIRIEKKNNRME